MSPFPWLLASILRDLARQSSSIARASAGNACIQAALRLPDSRVAACETTRMLSLAAPGLRPCQVEDLVAFRGGDRGDAQFAGRTLVLPGPPGDGRSVGRRVA